MCRVVCCTNDDESINYITTHLTLSPPSMLLFSNQQGRSRMESADTPPRCRGRKTLVLVLSALFAAARIGGMTLSGWRFSALLRFSWIAISCKGVQLPISPPEVSLLAYLSGLSFLTSSFRGLDMAVTRGVDGRLCAATRAHACVRACGWVWMVYVLNVKATT